MPGSHSFARVRIWDLPTRVFHALLVMAVIGLVITGEVGGARRVVPALVEQLDRPPQHVDLLDGLPHHRRPPPADKSRPPRGRRPRGHARASIRRLRRHQRRPQQLGRHGGHPALPAAGLLPGRPAGAAATRAADLLPLTSPLSNNSTLAPRFARESDSNRPIRPAPTMAKRLLAKVILLLITLTDKFHCHVYGTQQTFLPCLCLDRWIAQSESPWHQYVGSQRNHELLE